MTTNCVVCTDKYIIGQIKKEEIEEAYTWAPMPQFIPAGIGQQVPFMVVVPMCLECRRGQVRPGANGKLIQA